MKVGDKVRNKVSGKVGVIAYVCKERELRDCVVVRFEPQSDGLTMLKSSLEVVVDKMPKAKFNSLVNAVARMIDGDSDAGEVIALVVDMGHSRELGKEVAKELGR